MEPVVLFYVSSLLNSLIYSTFVLQLRFCFRKQNKIEMKLFFNYILTASKLNENVSNFPDTSRKTSNSATTCHFHLSIVDTDQLIFELSSSSISFFSFVDPGSIRGFQCGESSAAGGRSSRPGIAGKVLRTASYTLHSTLIRRD